MRNSTRQERLTGVAVHEGTHALDRIFDDKRELRANQNEIKYLNLLTKEIIEAFKKHPLLSQDGKGLEAHVLVKYFNPCGSGTWLITEAEKQEDGDWRLFGYCHLWDWEWDYVMLSELEQLRLPFGLTVERDLYHTGKRVQDFL